MQSLDKLYRNKGNLDIRVKKTFTVPLSQLYVEDNFNVRYGDITTDSVKGLIDAYCNGEPVPPLVVEVQDDGRMKIIAGHRRYKALTHIAQYHSMDCTERVEVRSIQAEAVDIIRYMVGENSGKNLNAVDIALTCSKLAEIGQSPSEIAETLGYTLSKVNYHLTIAKMSDDVKRAIVDGKIAADLAADIFRKSGNDGVINIISGAKTEKVTRANAGLWRPSMGKSIVSLLASVPTQISDNSVSITMSVDEWNQIKAGIDALNLGKGD